MVKIGLLHFLLYGLALGFPLGLLAQDDEELERKASDYVVIDPRGKKGFMFGGNLIYHLPNDQSAGFYDGAPKEEGFLDLQEYLTIDRIRNQILTELNNATSFRLVSYGSDMRYNNTLAFGAHVRYQFDWTNAIVADANFIGLKTESVFQLGYANDIGTSQLIYQDYPIRGTEDRLMLSLGYQVNFSEPSEASAYFEFGPEITSVRVKTNTFTVGQRNYSILRAQSIGSQNQLINNKIPTLTYYGAYAQLGTNLEFDKFTMELAWRSSYQRIDFNPAGEKKGQLSHSPMLRLVYRLSVKGF